MKYHALFVIFEKSRKILNCRLLQIIGGALRVNWHQLINVLMFMKICSFLSHRVNRWAVLSQLSAITLNATQYGILLTLNFASMQKSSLRFDTIHLGWTIVYMGHMLQFPNNILY